MHRLRSLAIVSIMVVALTSSLALIESPRLGASANPEDGLEPVDAGDPIPGDPIPGDPIPGAEEVSAMLRSYPDRFTAAEVRDGEWAIEMDGVWYSWALGRLLPDELRDRAEEYISIRFYRYDLGPVVHREVDPATAESLRARTAARSGDDTDARMRFNGFLDTLYGIGSERDAEYKVVSVTFLGFRTRVHPILVGPLERVERTIRARALADDSIRAFVEGLHAVHGFNWRNIAGTLRRSYHSYGVAVDLVPTSYQGRWAYWLWASQGGIDEWWDLPLASRWRVPDAVVAAFEEEGFIWGGKWLSFDNLHFEYRPEAILMAVERDQRLRSK